jgi:hypothetical protein
VSAERVRETFVSSRQESTYRASQELQMHQSSVWRILRKRLRAKEYRLQLFQTLNLPALWIGCAFDNDSSSTSLASTAT